MSLKDTVAYLWGRFDEDANELGCSGLGCLIALVVAAAIMTVATKGCGP